MRYAREVQLPNPWTGERLTTWAPQRHTVALVVERCADWLAANPWYIGPAVMIDQTAVYRKDLGSSAPGIARRVVVAI